MIDGQSRPVRARGLKLVTHDGRIHATEVAPRAGAWIETRSWQSRCQTSRGRAPCGRVD